jgi:phosphoribosylformimino-5-aminoimidazole carboxamide ribonucleotide (ProFAR) isomerase
MYFVDADGGDANHAVISKAINASHGRAQVDFEPGADSLESVATALKTGCHHAVVDATVPWLADAVTEHGKRIAVKVGVHEAALSTHATARDGSDLWSLLERLEKIGIHEYVILNTDRHGRWRHKSLKLLAAVCESVSPPVVSFGGVTKLEDLHQLVPLSSKGLTGCVVSEGLDSGAFTLSEARAAIEPRYDPYVWAPADPMDPQIGDSSRAGTSDPPVSAI